MSDSVKVDMLAAARDAQWSADTFLGLGSVKLVAPAKVNLFLGVGARRPDGYHEVTNVMHAVSLHDVLYVRIASASQSWSEEDLAPCYAWGGPQKNLRVYIDVADKAAAPGREPLSVPACDNLIFKAIDALACAIGHSACEEISVRVEKNIPHEGGLGGGSSNAAAALVAAANAWGLSEKDAVVEETARKLGADVAFFLQGGCALYEGAGEVFGHALSTMKDPIVLVKPPVGVSTVEAYRAFDQMGAKPPAELAAQARLARRACDVALFNNLAPTAESLAPELAEVRRWLASRPGVRREEDVLLCGSGATTFAFADSFASACDIAAAAQARGWWARATTLSSLRVAKVPQL